MPADTSRPSIPFLSFPTSYYGGYTSQTTSDKITFTVAPYQDSYWLSNQLIYVNATVSGGFRLVNTDNIDNACLSKNWVSYQNGYSDPWLASGKAVYEFGFDSHSANTMALVMGAKPGDTVTIYGRLIRRPNILYFADELPGDTKYVFSYPYKSWDYYSNGLSFNYKIGDVISIEYPYDDQEVVGFTDYYYTPEHGIRAVSNIEYGPGHPFWTGSYVAGSTPVPRFPRTYDWKNKRSLNPDYPTYGSPGLLKNSPLFQYYTGRELPINLYNELGYATDGGGRSLGYAGTIYPAVRPYYSPQRLTVTKYPYENNIKPYFYSSYSGMRLIGLSQTSGTSSVLKAAESYIIYKGYATHFESDGVYSTLTYMEKNSGTTTVFIGMTPTLTATPSNTPTSQPSATPSNTPTTTPTLTLTATPTPTNTGTSAPPPTPTRTPTSTLGLTPTPTNTVTPTRSIILRDQFIEIGNPNNPAYKFDKITQISQRPFATNGIGSVSKAFLIGKYEVSNYEYVQFLNAVGQNNANNIYAVPFDDPSAPYNSINGPGIIQSGFIGSYTYRVREGWENKPVNYVTIYSAARYCNWLHNNKPVDPTGNAVNSGAYDMSKERISRSPDAKYWIPSIHEWTKAAFYNPATGGYYKFGTASNDIPTKGLYGDGLNAANYDCETAGLQSIGSFPNSVNAYGLNDMVGGVRELTDTWMGTSSNIITLGAGYKDKIREIGIIDGMSTDLINGTISSQIGFRIAKAKQAVVPPPPTATPKILSCALSSDSSRVANGVNNQVCSQRFFVKNNPIKNIYGGSPIYESDIKLLQAMGIDFANRQNVSSFMKDVIEYRADSDLNSIALHMGAKAGDYVQLEINYVWRGHSIRYRNDGSNLVDIIPYNSYNPFFGQDFFRKLVNGSDPGLNDGWKNIPVDGAAPVEYKTSSKTTNYGWNFDKNILAPGNFAGLITIPYYKSGRLNLKESSLDSCTNAIIAYDPAYVQEFGKTGIQTVLNLISPIYIKDTVFNYPWAQDKPWMNVEFMSYAGVSFNGNYKTLDSQKDVTVGPMTTSLGFSAPVGDGYWIGIQDVYSVNTGNNYSEYYRFVSPNEDALAAVEYKFSEWLKNSPYGQIKKEIIDSLNTQIVEATNSLSSLSGTNAQRVSSNIRSLQDNLNAIQNTNETNAFGTYTILVKMTKQPAPPPPPSASVTPSLSKLGDINNQIFVQSPNYKSGLSDDSHLQQYINNPYNTNLVSTTNDVGVSGLIPNTRYVINSKIEGRKITYLPSVANSYTIEKWKNDILTIKFAQPTLSQNNITIKFKLENSSTENTYTVTVYKLKNIVSDFSKDFWFGSSVSSYLGDKLQTNTTYKKYISELSKYKFKAYYRVLSGPDKDINTWTPIGNDISSTTLEELGNFTNDYQSQILIRSNNLNTDILFPGEGKPSNPGYIENKPMFFTINFQSRLIEIRSIGANLKTWPNTIGANLAKINNTTADQYSLELYKGFDKQVDLIVSCWSPSENKYVNLSGTSSQLKFEISNVSGCNKSAVIIADQANIGYDSKNPNNGRVSISFNSDPFNSSVFTNKSGTITVTCSITASKQYQAMIKDIVIVWSVSSQKDIITISEIGTMYTGDSPSVFTISLASDTSSSKKIKTVTVSDTRILNLVSNNDSYSLSPIAIDTTNADLLRALKTASIKISVPANNYWLPAETTIPLTIYPSNARLARTPEKKYAYITSGISHFLGITSAGVLHVWGTNTNGVFAGSNTTTGVDDSRGLVNIIPHPNQKKWVQVESYGYNVYAIDSDGVLWGWGANLNASLGVGRDGIINTPTKIFPDLKWIDIACGMNHAIGLTDDGKVYGWGDGEYLQNGCGSISGISINVNTPRLIRNVGELGNSGFVKAVSVSCGPYSSWVIDQNNNLWAFGDLNGMVTSPKTFTPSLRTSVDYNSISTPYTQALTVAQGYYAPLTHHTINYSVRSYKPVFGVDKIVFDIINNPKYKWNPHKIRDVYSYNLLRVKNISANNNHVIAIDLQNKIYAWGNNIWNQCFVSNPVSKYYMRIGDTATDVNNKIPIGDDCTFIAISPGQSLFIDKDKKLWAIGKNSDGELSRLVPGGASANASYFQTLRQVPGNYRLLTCNTAGGFVETA